MTYPRGHSSAYTVRHELPAVVTEGDAYRSHGEVRLALKLILSNYEIVWRNCVSICLQNLHTRQ
jgi:hypothetical protein